MKSNLWAMYEHLSPGKVQAGEGAGYSDKLYSDYYWTQALWEFYNPKQAGAFSGFKNEHIPKPYRTAEEKIPSPGLSGFVCWWKREICIYLT